MPQRKRTSSSSKISKRPQTASYLRSPFAIDIAALWVRYRFALLVAAIAIAAIWVRTWRFGSVPPGLHQDEISTAYDAFSILHYGIDRMGSRFPLMLASWGSGMNAFSAYLAAPFIGLLGPNPAGVRLGQLLLCITSLIAFPYLGYKLRGKWFALLCAFLVAIAPWHILISRRALDENAFPAVFLLGVLFQVMGCTKHRYFVLAYFFFGLALYTHGAAYFTVPAYVGLSGAYLLWHRKIPPLTLLLSAIVFGLLALPHALYLAINVFKWDSITTPFFTIPRLPGIPRFETVSSVFAADPLSPVLSGLRSFWNFLFAQADWNIFSAVPEYGLIYMFSTPIALLGTLLLVTRIADAKTKFRPEILIVIWLFVCVALSVLLEANVNRMNVLLFPLLFALAEGVWFFRKHRLIFGSLIAIYVFSFMGFSSAYFSTYPSQVAPAFFSSYEKVLADTAHIREGTICVTTTDMNMPYIYVLFHHRVDPRIFLSTVVYENPGEEFQLVQSFGHYVFGLHLCPVHDASAIIAQNHESLPQEIFFEGNWAFEKTDAFTVAIRHRAPPPAAILDY